MCFSPQFLQCFVVFCRTWRQRSDHTCSSQVAVATPRGLKISVASISALETLSKEVRTEMGVVRAPTSKAGVNERAREQRTTRRRASSETKSPRGGERETRGAGTTTQHQHTNTTPEAFRVYSSERQTAPGARHWPCSTQWQPGSRK